MQTFYTRPTQILKPLNPSIDWGNPLTKGLVLDIPLSEGKGMVIKELVSNSFGYAFEIDNKPTWEATEYGPAIRFTGVAGQGFTFNSLLDTTDSNYDVTVQVFLKASALDSYTIFHKGAITDSGQDRYWRLRGDGGCAGGSVAFLPGWSTNNPGFGPNSYITTGTWFQVVVTNRRMDLNTAPTWHRLNMTTGAFSFDNTNTCFTVPGTGTKMQDSNEGYLGGFTSLLQGFNSRILLVRAWNRVLGSSPYVKNEIGQIMQNPWGIYKEAGLTGNMARYFDQVSAPATAIKDAIGYGGVVPFPR